MDKKFIEELRQKLEISRQELEQALNAFATKDKQLKGDWDTRLPDFGPAGAGTLEQESDEMEEYENRLPVEYGLELKLRDVNRAIKRIEEGLCGVCEKCGKEIPEERLRAVPEALAHIQCPT